MTTEYLILAVLAVLAILLFGLGFVVQWLFIAAVVVVIILAVQWFLRRDRT